MLSGSDKTDWVLLFTQMIAITGGERSVDVVLERTSVAPTTEARIAAALLECTARWGLAKTTIDDIAREAGVSRATVYRLYPGGKAAISNAASQAEVVRLSVHLAEGLRGVDDLEEALTRTLHLSVGFLAEQEAFRFLRDHEPAEFARLVTMERLESLLCTAGMILSPMLAQPFEAADIGDVALRDETAVWLARVIASHVLHPSDDADLADPDVARRIVRSFFLPALSPQPTQTG